MHTEAKPETLVKNLLDGLRERGVGIIQVWGAHVVRPGDQTYEVKAASFENGLLRVVLFLTRVSPFFQGLAELETRGQSIGNSTRM